MSNGRERLGLVSEGRGLAEERRVGLVSEGHGLAEERCINLVSEGRGLVDEGCNSPIGERSVHISERCGYTAGVSGFVCEERHESSGSSDGVCAVSGGSEGGAVHGERSESGVGHKGSSGARSLGAAEDQVLPSAGGSVVSSDRRGPDPMVVDPGHDIAPKQLVHLVVLKPILC